MWSAPRMNGGSPVYFLKFLPQFYAKAKPLLVELHLLWLVSYSVAGQYPLTIATWACVDSVELLTPEIQDWL